MSLFQADAVLKASVELMIEDMQANTWLLDDVFSNFKENPYLKKKYHTQIQDAKTWFLNNRIHIELGYTEDSADLPKISIVLGDQQQDANMSTMGDTSPHEVKLFPNQINKPIPFVVKPFTPVSYDVGSGLLTVPNNLANFNNAVVGQVLVNTITAKGFIIQQIIGTNTILLDSGTVIGDGNLAIVPKYAFYEAKVEHIWENVVYHIICTAMGDAQVAIWMHDIVKYGLLRYKQGLLEALGLYESLFNSKALVQNPNFTDGAQKAWERTIEITGKIQTTFIKAPHRIIESASFVNTSPDSGPVPPGGPTPAPEPESDWSAGILIASNTTPDTPEEMAQELWAPIEDDNP